MKGKNKCLILLAVVTVLLSGCTLFAKKNGSVNLTMQLKDGMAIDGVEVTMTLGKTSAKATTDKNGFVKFVLAPGEYSLKANIVLIDNSTYSISRKVGIKSGDLTKETILDEALGRVTATVVHATSGNPIGKSNVVIIDGDKTYTKQTNAEGVAAFYMKKGTYQVKAENMGIESELEDLVVPSGKLAKQISLEVNEFKGTVAFVDGTKVEKAKVKVGTTEKETDEDGKFVMYLKENTADVSISYLDQVFTKAAVDLTKELNYVINDFGLYTITVVDKNGKPVQVKEIKVEGKALIKVGEGSFQGLIGVGEKTPVAIIGSAYNRNLNAITVESKKKTETIKLTSLRTFTSFADFGDNLYKTGTWEENNGEFIATAASECRFISNIRVTGHYAYSVDVLYGARYSPSIAHQVANAYYNGAVTVDSKLGKFAIRSHTTVGSLKENQTDCVVPNDKWVNILMVMKQDNSVEVTITNLDNGEVILDKAVLPGTDNLYRDGYLGFRGFNNTKFKNIFVDEIAPAV